VQGSQLTSGSVAIIASYGTVSSTISITVTPSGGSLLIQGVTNAASYQSIFAPGAIVAIFGTQLATSTVAASTIPLPVQLGGASVTINGIAAPLYYASPGQLNVQIPYTITANSLSLAILTVNCNGQSASTQFGVEAAAPGIFTDSTGALVGYASVAAGQTIALYMTGEGVDSPSAVTGSTPAPNVTPKPVQAVSITVGGIAVATPYAYIGTPSWAIGITQVNFTIPSSVAAGLQKVVATVGGVASAAASVTVTK
jgi:adhesin/invasin